MSQPSVVQSPYRIAPDTWVIPQIEPAGPDVFVSINSMVIAGAEPVIVDTGCAINRERWVEDAFGIVDPADVRWIYLSHTDRDHVGNLPVLLDACPNATIITTMWGVRYMLADGPPPLDRMRWVNDGEAFTAGDRTLHAVRPPVWDSTNTRGLYDPTTGVYWAADSFASLFSEPVTDAAQLDQEFWRETFLYEHRSACEWHTMLDPAKFDTHIARSEGLHPAVVASAHGPVLYGSMISEAYALIHQITRMEPVRAEDQSVLDHMITMLANAA